MSRSRILAGVACAVVLFVAVVATSICCCLYTCHRLYRRHRQLQSLFEGRDSAGRGDLGRACCAQGATEAQGV